MKAYMDFCISGSQRALTPLLRLFSLCIFFYLKFPCGNFVWIGRCSSEWWRGSTVTFMRNLDLGFAFSEIFVCWKRALIPLLDLVSLCIPVYWKFASEFYVWQRDAAAMGGSFCCSDSFRSASSFIWNSPAGILCGLKDIKRLGCGGTMGTVLCLITYLTDHCNLGWWDSELSPCPSGMRKNAWTQFAHT